MSAAMSTAGPQSLDIGEAFGYIFRSRNWFGKLAAGALCLLFFWLLLIPVFILLGYNIEAARVTRAGGRELPPWSDIGKKLSDGFLLAVALFVWNLPGIILDSAGGTQQSSNSGLAALGSLYGLLVGFLTAAIWNQYLDGGLSAAFDFGAVFRRAGFNPGLTVIVWLMGIVAGIIGFLGIIIVVVGILFTIPYAYAMLAHLYGQYGRITEVRAAPAAPTTTA
jgi:hypothetical protein